MTTGGVEKRLYCKYCEKITEHVSISYAESYLIHNKKPTLHSIISDHVPLSKKIHGQLYVCTECNSTRSLGAIYGDQ